MGLYSKKGLYSGYKKNNKEREALDYYATPSQEVKNILEVLNLDLSSAKILEPCCGGGHMVKGILDYITEQYKNDKIEYNIIATDVKERESILTEQKCHLAEEYDFLGDNYPCWENIDYVIMNPPYSTIEPFVIRGLEIAEKGLLLLGRLQFLEGQSRYENLLKDNPPSDVYIYVDRIKCYKNGHFSQTESSSQAYAWFYWDNKDIDKITKVHWIRRK